MLFYLFLSFLCFEFNGVLASHIPIGNIDYFSRLPDEVILQCAPIKCAPECDYEFITIVTKKLQSYKDHQIPFNEFNTIRSTYNKIRSLKEPENKILIPIMLVNTRFYRLFTRQSIIDNHNDKYHNPFLNTQFDICYFFKNNVDSLHYLPINKGIENLIYSLFNNALLGYVTGMICIQNDPQNEEYSLSQQNNMNVKEINNKIVFSCSFSKKEKDKERLTRNSLLTSLIDLNQSKSLTVQKIIDLFKRLQKQCIFCSLSDTDCCSCDQLINIFDIIYNLLDNKNQPIKLAQNETVELRIMNGVATCTERKVKLEITLPEQLLLPIKLLFNNRIIEQ